MKPTDFFPLGGFRFRVILEDYGYCDAKSIRYKYNKQNMRRALELKKSEERDYLCTDYDCNGSTQVRIEIHHNKRELWLKFHWRKDV